VKDGGSNLVASVRQRLLNGARDRGEEFQLTLTRYAIERLLYRLSQSPHHDDFILKGAALYAVWSKEVENVIYRPTRDLDLWSIGNPPVEFKRRRRRVILKHIGYRAATGWKPDQFPASPVR
jgi:hypothetical protein